MTFNVGLLQRAIELAESGLGLTYPNPIVGAVIVNGDEEVIGEGFHAGAEHAEVLAIADARARGHDLAGSIFRQIGYTEGKLDLHFTAFRHCDLLGLTR